MHKTTAIIVAGGKGSRMGGKIKKQYLKVNNKEIIAHTLAVFEKHPQISEMIVVTSEEDRDYVDERIQYYQYKKVSQVVAGGKERQDSVANGLEAVSEDSEYIMIHDGARPLITETIISKALEKTYEVDATVVAVPVKDTIKVVDTAGIVEATPARTSLWAIQTPQTFEATLIKEAYREAKDKGLIGTDDSTLVEALGKAVHIVEGSYSNIKVTTPEDLEIVKNLMAQPTD